MENKSIDIAKPLIKSFECLRLQSYICSSGHKTIGYGHKIILGHDKFDEYITKKIAEKLLDEDCHNSYSILKEFVQANLSLNQIAALISFIFNIGSTQFQSSTMRKLLNGNSLLEASNEFPRWIYITKKDGTREVSAGLARRRQEEQKLFLRENEE